MASSRVPGAPARPGGPCRRGRPLRSRGRLDDLPELRLVHHRAVDHRGDWSGGGAGWGPVRQGAGSGASAGAHAPSTNAASSSGARRPSLPRTSLSVGGGVAIRGAHWRGFPRSAVGASPASTRAHCLDGSRPPARIAARERRTRWKGVAPSGTGRAASRTTPAERPGPRATASTKPARRRRWRCRVGACAPSRPRRPRVRDELVQLATTPASAAGISIPPARAVPCHADGSPPGGGESRQLAAAGRRATRRASVGHVPGGDPPGPPPCGRPR